MIDIIKYIFTHFTTYGWFGWFSKSYNELSTATWDSIGIVMWIIIFVFLFFNICYFIYDYIEQNRNYPFLYFIGALSYIIFNQISLIFLSCLFLSIGGFIGFSVMGVLYILMILTHLIVNKEDEDDYYGYLNFMEIAIDYFQEVGEQLHKRRLLKQKYYKFLNQKYGYN